MCHSTRLAGTENTGNLRAVHALESATILAQLTLIDLQTNGRPIPDNLIIITNYAGSINRIAKFRPHPMQPVSIAFRNVTDQLLRTFNRLKISIRWVPALRTLLGFRCRHSLVKHLAATPPPPNFADTVSIDTICTMSRKSAINKWMVRWHATERTSHAYTEVLRHPPDGRLCQGLAALAKSKPDKKPSREAESTLFRFLMGHAFTSKYSQHFHAEQALSFACECGFSPQTVNHVVFDCPLYNAAHAANPRFDFDDHSGQPIKQLHGLLCSAT